MWLLIFANGIVGTIAFCAFFTIRFLRHWRDRGAYSLAGCCVLIACTLFMITYDMVEVPLYTVMIAVALMWRARRDERGVPGSRPRVRALTAEEAVSGGEVSAEETRAAWIAAVEELWPDATVEPVGPGQSDGARRELAFLPDARHPRLLVPAGLPRATATALRRYSHDLGVKQRASRGLTAAAVRTGLPERTLRDRLRVTGGPSIEDRLAELLGRPVVVSVGLGSARANRKPILHVLSPRGSPSRSSRSATPARPAACWTARPPPSPT